MSTIETIETLEADVHMQSVKLINGITDVIRKHDVTDHAIYISLMTLVAEMYLLDTEGDDTDARLPAYIEMVGDAIKALVAAARGTPVGNAAETGARTQ